MARACDTGEEVGRHEFLPFGEEWDGPSPPEERRLFSGQERDFETGLDYFGARYLRADLGRFTTIDPVYTWAENLVDPQRWNRYAYARNNPLRWVDPDGRLPVPAITGAIGAVVYFGWNAYQNVQRGEPWHKNGGVEATKGLLVGATLGFAAPALATSEVALGAAEAATVGTAATRLSSGASRLNHIFGKAEHALDDFVAANGSREAAFDAVQKAANEALRLGRLTPNAKGILPSGDAGNIIEVGGTTVRLIGGRVVNGVVEISSFSRKGL